MINDGGNSFRESVKCEKRNKFNAGNFFICFLTHSARTRISSAGDEIYLWILSTAPKGKPFHLSFPQNLNNRT